MLVNLPAYYDMSSPDFVAVVVVSPKLLFTNEKSGMTLECPIV